MSIDNNKMVNNFKGSIPEFGATIESKIDNKKDSFKFFQQNILQHFMRT